MDNSSKNTQGELLIIDDLVENLRVLSTTLSKQGYRVRCVKNGAMALIGAKASLPDVILLDIRMPGMDGYEVCHHLKADPQTRDIPIIFLSAFDEPLDKAKAFEAGGADFIIKPFHMEEVLARINNQMTIQRLKKQLIAYRNSEQKHATFELPNPTQPVSPQISFELLPHINTILRYSHLLSESALSTEQQEGLRMIHQSGQELLELAQRLQKCLRPNSTTESPERE